MDIKEIEKIGSNVYGESTSAYLKWGDMFLLKRHIEVLESLRKENKIHIEEFNLTEAEALSIVILEGFGSVKLIQQPLFDSSKSNQLKETIIKCLDKALTKIPSNSHQLLYANDGFSRSNNKIGDVFTVKGFLTTSIDDFDNANYIKWVVTPKSINETKAHEIYRVYNHGDDLPYPEYQVEFERGSSFKITQIEKVKNCDIIHICEI